MNTPTGGRRDRKPPVVVLSNPVNRATNFMDNKVEIEFDEFVVLDNINEKFMVSPPLKKRPEIEIKKRSVVATFDEELRDSTTYTFYFQDAIKDLNEGNILENYQFVFSTGPVVDSLSVTGNVYNSYTLETPEKSIVLMYSDLTDSAVMKQLPDYISMIDANGYFRIENVHEGIYRLYALKDVDNSKNYNLRDEEFAFLDSAINITPERNYIAPARDTATIKDTTALKTADGKDKPDQKEPAKTGNGKTVPGTPQVVKDTVVQKGDYKLILFAAQKKAHYLTSSERPAKYTLLYTLSIPPDSLKFDFSIPEAKEDAYIIERNQRRDTLKVWLTDSTIYSQPQITTWVTYPFTDSVGNVDYKKDTIMMRYLEPRQTRGAKAKKSFPVLYSISGGNLKPGKKIIISSETPLREPDTTRIRLYELKDSVRVNLRYTLRKDSTNTGRYYVDAAILEKKDYLFIADSAAFGDIYNEKSDSTGIKFSIKDPEDYNKLALNIQNYKGNLIIQLLDKQEKLVAEIYYKGNGKIEFPLLEPGSYRLKAIFDLNGDGIWTTGDFETHLQPEPVSYYPDELEMKPGWDADQDWDLGTFNFKEQKLRSARKGK
jgi:hypothetical protein